MSVEPYQNHCWLSVISTIPKQGFYVIIFNHAQFCTYYFSQFTVQKHTFPVHKRTSRGDFLLFWIHFVVIQRYYHGPLLTFVLKHLYLSIYLPAPIAQELGSSRSWIRIIAAPYQRHYNGTSSSFAGARITRVVIGKYKR